MAMTKLGAAAEALAAMFEDVGITAHIDTQRAELPCALIMPGRLDLSRLDAQTYTVEWDVYLVAADNGPAEALDDLGDMLTLVAPQFAIEEAVPAVVSLASHQDREFPALQFKVVTEVTPDEEK